MSGILYVIGTPIGNLGDITLRALETLDKVEVLVCEDSRVASRLVNLYREKGLLHATPRYLAYNEFNESRMAPEVVRLVSEGHVVGLVTDAGMPALSDPGYRAIRGVLDARLPVQIVPGVTALTTALVWSALGGEVFTYLGFLPKTSGKADRLLATALRIWEDVPSARIALYVSPHRLLKDLEAISRVMGEVRCTLCRELTKMHEERVEGTTSQLLQHYATAGVKGEIVLVLAKESLD